MPRATSVHPVLERFRKLSRQAFEDAIAAIYRGEGYLVEPAAHGPDDRGYDLVLLRENSVLVRCKHWRVDQVGVPPVRELAAGMHKVGATGGVFVTTGAFTKPAREFAVSKAIQLVDGEALIRRFSGDQKHPGKSQKAA
jgi:restriction system protein